MAAKRQRVLDSWVCSAPKFQEDAPGTEITEQEKCSRGWNKIRSDEFSIAVANKMEVNPTMSIWQLSKEPNVSSTTLRRIAMNLSIMLVGVTVIGKLAMFPTAMLSLWRPPSSVCGRDVRGVCKKGLCGLLTSPGGHGQGKWLFRELKVYDRNIMFGNFIQVRVL